MPELNNLALFILAGLTLNITPGPDMMFVITRSVAESARSGVVSSLGIAAGSVFHTLAVALGLSALLMAVPAAYEVIKYTGAAYLVYLGLKMLFSKQSLKLSDDKKPVKMHSVFLQAMVTNIFNPKVALFFLAFLPQFVNPEGNITLQLTLLGLLFNFNGTIVNILVALSAGRLGKFIKLKLNNSSLFKWITASVFIGLGIRLALLEKK
ncbi:MAG TPA: LysE family translocator [Ignavibacteria bacterium]|nr:LysE family translocator [Ignavibacteria bacterium]